MTTTKIELKPMQQMRIVVRGRPQLISAITKSVTIEINKYSDDYNISYSYEGLFVSLWCDEYSIEGGKNE